MAVKRPKNEIELTRGFGCLKKKKKKNLRSSIVLFTTVVFWGVLFLSHFYSLWPKSIYIDGQLILLWCGQASCPSPGKDHLKNRLNQPSLITLAQARLDHHPTIGTFETIDHYICSSLPCLDLAQKAAPRALHFGFFPFAGCQQGLLRHPLLSHSSSVNQPGEILTDFSSAPEALPRISSSLEPFGVYRAPGVQPADQRPWPMSG